MVAEVNSGGLINVKQSRAMNDLRDFANQWDHNLKEQGFGVVSSAPP